MNTFTRNIKLILLLLIFISFFLSCEKEESQSSTSPSIELISIEKSSATALNTDVIEYDYHETEQTLIIFHHNTALNYSQKLNLSFSLINNKINITEKEMNISTDGLELYTVCYKIRNLDPKSYKLKIEEPYVKLNKDKLEFSIDLSKNERGNFYIKRNFYPWGR